MTLHAAVIGQGAGISGSFHCGLRGGVAALPSPHEPLDQPAERRLFYVGMTRAREQLILTRAKSRFLLGQSQQNEPFRFVAEIEASLKEIKEAARRKPSPPAAEELRLPLF